MGKWDMRGLAFLATLTVLVAGSSRAKADTIAVTFRSSTYQGGGFNQNIGWEFTTNVPLTVTRLGWFDLTSILGGVPGFSVGHTIGIFTDTGQLLVSGSVSPGTADPAEGPPVTNTLGSIAGVFRYVAVTPTTLSGGQTYIIAGTNPPGSDDAFAVAFPLSDLTVDPSISFVQGRVSPLGTGGSLLFPTTTQPPAIFNARNFGPNFQFQIVPEPSTFVLLAAGVAGLGILRCLKVRAIR